MWIPEIDLAHHAAHDTTYRLYITIGQIFHPTMTTGLVPMGILIYMNLDIFKGKYNPIWLCNKTDIWTDTNIFFFK